MSWSEQFLYVKFIANQDEPLVVSNEPNLEAKTVGLWEKDVCELFIALDAKDFRHYFEFEVTPTGEWIDLGIHQKADERITDWKYQSNMQTAADIKSDKVVMAFKVSWTALGKTPNHGDIWLGNLFRAMGSEPNWSYLSWSATETKNANFHIPEKFSKIVFK